MGLYEYTENSIIRSIVQFINGIILFVSIAWFIVFCFGSQFIISGQSMTPVLNAEDMCLIDSISYNFGRPSRFDIVVFERADNGQENVKRVIGLPGETVQIVSGAVYINNHKLEDERLSPVTSAGIAQNPVVLQNDEYFLLGDNPTSSEDSRSQSIGNVNKNRIKGRLWFRLKPFADMGRLK